MLIKEWLSLDDFKTQNLCLKRFAIFKLKKFCESPEIKTSKSIITDETFIRILMREFIFTNVLEFRVNLIKIVRIFINIYKNFILLQ